MTDLIFHIGFSKCASTTLQIRVFPTDPGYIGTYPSTGKQVKGRINYAKQFQNLSPIGVKIRGNLKQAEKWKHSVLTHKNAHVPDLDRLIVSSEFFTQSNKIKKRPIIEFLKKFDENIWDDGRVKIVLVLRNQAERIASGYAQDSKTEPHASQAHFVQHVSRYLNKKGSLMDYATWIEELQDAFGKDNVLVLLTEDIGNIEFWFKLKSFCELKEFEPESMLNRKRDHAKRIGDNCWRLQPFNSAFKAKVWGNNLLRLIWPHHIKKDLRETTRLALIQKFTMFYENSLYRSDPETRENKIQLTESLQEQVKKHYYESNIRLSELLDRDLTKLGY